MEATRVGEAAARQVALVFDLNKCMGCQSCAVACKQLWTREPGEEQQWWCSVNTEPRRCGEDPALGPNWDEDQGGGAYPNAYFFYLPRLCNHCTRPVCVEACPEGAMYKRETDGIVLRDEERCRGVRACAEACPYQKIYFNAVRGVSQHCNLCFPRLEQGVAPACVRNCPGRLVFVGMIDDEEGPVHRLVRQWGVALPLHPEHGTESNVFYVPPLSASTIREDGSIDADTPRIPQELLESLFGPEVHAALDRLRAELAAVRAGGRSEILETLIAYEWRSLLGPFDAEPARIGPRAPAPASSGAEDSR